MLTCADLRPRPKRNNWIVFTLAALVAVGLYALILICAMPASGVGAVNAFTTCPMCSP